MTEQQNNPGRKLAREMLADFTELFSGLAGAMQPTEVDTSMAVMIACCLHRERNLHVARIDGAVIAFFGNDVSSHLPSGGSSPLRKGCQRLPRSRDIQGCSWPGGVLRMSCAGQEERRLRSELHPELPMLPDSRR